jgi:CheY-like chemotaxis protein
MNRKVILVADDSPWDIYLLQRAFSKINCLGRVEVARDGQEAMDYFNGEGEFADRLRFKRPCLVLLDLKMPRLDGFQVLEFVRSRSDYKCMPIVVLTSSDEPSDMQRAYDLGANSYVCKPSDPERLDIFVDVVTKFWTDFNRMPLSD